MTFLACCAQSIILANVRTFPTSVENSKKVQLTFLGISQPRLEKFLHLLVLCLEHTQARKAMVKKLLQQKSASEEVWTLQFSSGYLLQVQVVSLQKLSGVAKEGPKEGVKSDHLQLLCDISTPKEGVF